MLLMVMMILILMAMIIMNMHLAVKMFSFTPHH